MRTTAPVSMVRHGYVYVRLPEPTGHLGQIVIDANVQDGEPCIRGTRIPASTIATYYDGTNMKYICNAWGITERQVQECCDYVNAPVRRVE